MIVTRSSYINSALEIENELKAIFNCEDILIIFDIGSCEGEDSIRYSKIFPNARIFAVEALPSNLSLIKSNLEKYLVTNVQIIPFALSDEMGLADFFVSSGQYSDKTEEQDWDYGNKSSSLLPPNKHLEVVPWLKFQDTISVECRTLKDICNEKNVSSIDFIHMDVQGAELKVLRGAKELIKEIKVIWLEVEAVELYHGQPLKSEVEKFMNQNEFIKIKDTVGNVSGDQLYVNLSKLPMTLSLVYLILKFHAQNIIGGISCLVQKLGQKMNRLVYFG